MSQKIKVATPLVGQEEIKAVSEVLLSGNYVSGKEVEAFEKEFADYIGVPYAVAVNSGTSALYIALEAMGVSKGDEVIVPPLTFFATISSVLYLGATPVFADLDLDDLCLSPESVEKKITDRTKVILPVHIFGGVAKMDQLTTLGEKFGVKVLEDCAQAHGSEFKGRKVGSIGNAGAFSFFATKHMTTGEGGIITTPDKGVYETARVLRNHGMSGRDGHIRLGYNNRMTEMEAAMGRVQLGKMDQHNQARIANSERILGFLRGKEWAEIPVAEQTGNVHTYFWCPVMVNESYGKDVNDLKDHLKQHGIEFRHRYREPLYRQTVLERIGLDYSSVFLENAEKVTGKIIGLPNHPGLSEKDLDIICDVLDMF